MNKQNVLIVGSGHNGLVTACYLAKEGYKVTVLERRDMAGGAVATETMFRSDRFPNGFRMDVGSSVHIMIHQTGIIEELSLEEYGLDYIEMDPIMSYPLPEGEGVIHFFKDLDRTLDSIARVCPEDVENYRDFVEFWGRVNEGVLKAFMVPPSGKNIATELIKGQWRDGSMFEKGKQTEGLQKIFSSYGKVVDDAFENRYLKAAMTWFAAQSGPTPDHPATGDFAGWQSMLHQSGAKHPRGGSGMLTQAMVAFLEDHGGKVLTGEPVQQVLIDEGKAIGVRTEENEYRADIVISNAHVQTTMMKLVGREYLSPGTYTKVENINVGNGFGMVIRCAVEELPRYEACPGDPHIHNGMQLLAPSVGYMNDAIGDYLQKKPPENPAVLAMTFSNIDPEVAPDGGHTLYAWAQWHPYELRDDLHWDDIREREAEKIYEVVCRYAPNMKGELIDWYIQSPLDIERKHAMPKGNVMHVEMSFDQMFMFRPIPEMSKYRTPIENLYLSSASCHPGGGVFGAAGYNAAQIVLKDLKKKSWLKF
ncbi:NAD(P)/FAD-dependent oxidoreductase [Aliifodinibius salicampi]|uniref:Pyridine nucleotide-disulfide oxidoreductase domain-containing protein 2 n=1 Tax=Fodinibius salicampi TaxID=1920655 RepID=A0ABT3PXV7_9BACT|nr:NAD(P)/FAD-dependent oxidoreductase [Fodinibius salicampi]MCW9712702.1 NAD(P)/FAD-dependent oxidoreductase [Fodinibius salicampi]